MDPSRLYHHLNLPANFIDFGRQVPKSPFHFFGGGGGPNSKTTDDERLALLDRFRLEGLDVRKLNDAQKLPFVWRWLVDAEINGQSLRHQIDKMRCQHEEELQEVEDYIEQVWKLSTERLILLEEENKCLRHSVATNNAGNGVGGGNQRRYSKDNNNLGDSTTGDLLDDDDGEDSEGELEKCLYGGKPKRPTQLVPPHNNRGNGNGQLLYPASTRVNNLVNSSSVSSLGSSTSVSTGLNNLCDSLKMRSSRSCWQLSNGSSNGSSTNGNEKTPDMNAKTPTNGATTGGDHYCEKCEILDAELMEMRAKCADLEGALDDANEKNFVLEKLNRSIEIENENFAYKLAEAEDRSNQLERRILHMDKECRHLKASIASSNSPSLVGTASSSTSGIGTMSNHSATKLVPSPADTRRLIDELNHKVKSLEEALDHRSQLYEELELKYEKQKEKQNETLWKLRNFIQDKESSKATNDGSNLYDELMLRQEDDQMLRPRAASNDNNSSGLLTMDPLGPIGQHFRSLHRNSSVHLV